MAPIVRKLSWAIQRTEGSALVFVLLLLTLLSVLLAGVMGLYQVREKWVRRDVHRTQARYLAESGLYAALDLLEKHSDATSIAVPFKTGSAEAKIQPFGGFYAIFATGKSHESQVSLHALVGAIPGMFWDASLVVGDVSSSLYAVQNTHISGIAYLGPLGIETRSMGFRPFTGQLQLDIKALPPDQFPYFNPVLINRSIAQLQNLVHQPPDHAQPGTALLDPTSWKIEPGQPIILILPPRADVFLPANWKPRVPVWIIGQGDLRIAGQGVFPDGSVITSAGRLTLAGALQLHHTVCFSPNELGVQDMVRGSAQFLSYRRVFIQDRVYVEWPGLAYVSGVRIGDVRQGELSVSGHAVVDGTLLLPAPDVPVRYDEARIRLRHPAVLRGALYSANQTEVDGTVLGTLMTSQFYFYEAPGAYINWIRNVFLERAGRPPFFILPIGFNEHTPLTILARWEDAPL